MNVRVVFFLFFWNFLVGSIKGYVTMNIPNFFTWHPLSPCVSPSKLKSKNRQIIFEETRLRRMYFARFAILEMPIISPPLGLAGPNYWHKQSRLGHWTMEMICSECLAISIITNSILYFLEVFVFLHILCHHQAFMTLNLKLFEKLILLNNYVL